MWGVLLCLSCPVTVPGPLKTGIEVIGFWWMQKKSQKLLCTVRRQTQPRYAIGKSANFVPKIFFARYNIERKNTRPQNHVNER